MKGSPDFVEGDGPARLHAPAKEITVAEIVLEDVSKVYEGGTLAVANLDLTIEDGELMVMVGPSGCGKTTALRMLAGLEEITEGTISIGDEIVNDLSPKERDIAMVFQNQRFPKPRAHVRFMPGAPSIP